MMKRPLLLAAMIVFAAQQAVCIGIATGADDVVDTSTVIVPAIPVQGVLRDRSERPQMRQGAPKPVAGG